MNHVSYRPDLISYGKETSHWLLKLSSAFTAAEFEIQYMLSAVDGDPDRNDGKLIFAQMNFVEHQSNPVLW